MTAAPVTPRTVEDLLLAYDRSRDRTKQREIGMSDVGSCRRRAGYRLAGVEPTNEGGSVPAVLGTAIHAVLAEQAIKDAEDGDLVEHAVSFAGILGHLDHYKAAARTLVDWKTVSRRRLDSIELDGIPLNHRHSTALYAAACALSGRPVERIVLDYICRDTGETHRAERPFVHDEVEAALEWIANVRDADLEMLPRDYRPDSPVCGNCPFLDLCWTNNAMPGRNPLTALWSDDPDAAKWAAELEDARREQGRVKDRVERAKGALDALRPDGGGRLAIAGFNKSLSWSESSSWIIDRDAVEAEYRAAGARPPMKQVTKVTLNLVKQKPSDPRRSA